MPSTVATVELEISPLGSEYVAVEYSFKQYPSLASGDTILPSPSPVVEQVCVPAGQPPLAFGPPVIINSGTGAAFFVKAAAGSTAGTEYQTICTVWTAQGQILKGRCDYVLVTMA